MSHGPGRKAIQRLILVFDADSGKVAAFVDSARKLLMLKGCALCSLTHGTFGEREDWQSCKVELGVPIEYHHRDDMPDDVREAAAGRLPCVLAAVEDEPLILLLTPEVLDRCRGHVADLKGRLLYHANARNLELSLTS